MRKSIYVANVAPVRSETLATDAISRVSDKGMIRGQESIQAYRMQAGTGLFRPLLAVFLEILSGLFSLSGNSGPVSIASGSELERSGWRAVSRIWSSLADMLRVASRALLCSARDFGARIKSVMNSCRQGWRNSCAGSQKLFQTEPSRYWTAAQSGHSDFGRTVKCPRRVQHQGLVGAIRRVLCSRS